MVYDWQRPTEEVMAKEFIKPYNLDADYSDDGGKNYDYEWAYWWGSPPEGVLTIWRVQDITGKTLSSHRTREKAEEALKRANNA